jgi:hypothetical protein
MEEEEQEEQLPKAVAERSPAASPAPPLPPPRKTSVTDGQTDVVNLYIGFPWFGFLIYRSNKWLTYVNFFGIHFCLIEAMNFLYL